MSQIKAGDMVQLVWACCAISREYMGWTGEVKEVRNRVIRCDNCGHRSHGYHARLAINGPDPDLDAGVPPAWLIKIEPPAKEQTETTEEELVV